jgi:hypothetical protein
MKASTGYASALARSRLSTARRSVSSPTPSGSPPSFTRCVCSRLPSTGKVITGDQRTNPLRRLLLRNGRDLDSKSRWALQTWLAQHPALRELYEAKEALSGFYRIRNGEWCDSTTASG